MTNGDVYGQAGDYKTHRILAVQAVRSINVSIAVIFDISPTANLVAWRMLPSLDRSKKRGYALPQADDRRANSLENFVRSERSFTRV